MPRSPQEIALPGLALVLFVACLASTAWLADDAFITLRSVDNLLHGFGPRWNVVERVQTYTHPLWMLLTAGVAGVTGEYVRSLLLQSALVSTLAVGLLALRLARTTSSACLATLALTLSSAFIDYSTSGLENPLTHLLLGLFAATFLGRSGSRRVLRLALLTGLLVVNRLDTLLLCLPALAVEVWRARSAASLRALALGLMPLLLWELCALLYYGFPFPNTAYAKLGSGIDSGQLAARGLEYLGQSLRADPLTLVATFAGLATVVKVREHAPLALGVLLYLGYVVSVGGDFMAGRFLTAPLFLSVVMLARLPLRFPSLGSLAACAVLSLLSLSAARPACASARGLVGTQPLAAHGISDERFQYPETAFVNLGLHGEIDGVLARDGRRARDAGLEVVALHAVGMAGFFAGPQVHVLDRAALCDPLLARLPAQYDPTWRTGHFWRALPAGYPESLPDREARLEDPELQRYLQALRLVTRAPLFDSARLRMLWTLNTGGLEIALDRDLYRHPRMTRVALQPRVAGGWSWAPTPGLELPAAVIECSAPELLHGLEIRCITEPLRAVRVVLYRGSRAVLDGRPEVLAREGNRRTYSVSVPADVARGGFDRVRVFPAQLREPSRERAHWIQGLEVLESP